MRRILLFTRNGISAIASVAKRASFVALTAGVIATMGASREAAAQYPALYATSNTNFSVNPAAAQSAGSNSSGVMRLGEISSGQVSSNGVVDGSYFGSASDSSVKPASYMGGARYNQQCGPNGCAAYGPNACCDVSWYAEYEAMWLRREGHRRFSLTQNVFMNNPDYQYGGRYTIGKMLDCANSWEFVYAGPFRWTRGSDFTNVGNVNSKFLAVPASLQNGFDGANRHVQSLRQSLDSFEVNRRWWAWDAISTLIGIRYLKYQDHYSLTSVRAAAPLLSNYRDNIDNDMVGLQVGGNVYVPTSLRTLVSFRGKAGVYGNFASRDLRIVKDGAVALRNLTDDVNIAGVVEFGVNGIYEVTPSIRLTSGYEAWLLPGSATVSNQRSQLLNAGSGTAIRMKDTVVLHGFTVGAQVLF